MHAGLPPPEAPLVAALAAAGPDRGGRLGHRRRTCHVQGVVGRLGAVASTCHRPREPLPIVARRVAPWKARALRPIIPPSLRGPEKRQTFHVSTIEPMVPRGPLDWSPWPEPPPPPERRPRRWLRATVLVVLSLLTLTVIASNFVTLPYYAIAPGSARPVVDLVTVSDKSKAFPHKGDVLFTTVSLYKAKPFEAVQSWFDHNIELVPEKNILGSTPPGQLNQQN